MYKSNKLNGVSIINNKKGQLFTTTTYKNDKKHGVFNSFDVQKNKRESGNYFNDLKNGSWIIYSKSGQITSEKKYKNGEMIE